MTSVAKLLADAQRAAADQAVKAAERGAHGIAGAWRDIALRSGQLVTEATKLMARVDPALSRVWTEEDRAAIANCPTPVYHETHYYCPSCPWTEEFMAHSEFDLQPDEAKLDCGCYAIKVEGGWRITGQKTLCPKDHRLQEFGTA